MAGDDADLEVQCDECGEILSQHSIDFFIDFFGHGMIFLSFIWEGGPTSQVEVQNFVSSTKHVLFVFLYMCRSNALFLQALIQYCILVALVFCLC